MDIKTFKSVMGKSRHGTIFISAAKPIFMPVNTVIGKELSWVKLENYTAVR